MLKKTFILIALCLVLPVLADEIPQSGVTNQVPNSSGTLQDYFQKVRQKTDEPVITNKTTTGNIDIKTQAAKAYEKTGKAYPVIQDDLIIYPYGEMIPEISCKPLWATSIELEPGETLLQTVAADGKRWIISYITYGTGPNQVYTVIVKPKYTDDYKTNLLIATSKRMYNVILKTAQDDQYFPRISFYYPQDLVQTWNVVQTQKTSQKAEDEKMVLPIGSVNISKANFDWIISGDDSILWKPNQVFDVNGHVYIVMPDIEGMEAPALVLRSKTGQDLLVNYRVIGERRNVYMVDKIFKIAALIIGSGKDKEEVLIYPKKYSDLDTSKLKKKNVYPER